jgi:hypothetical protein
VAVYLYPNLLIAILIMLSLTVFITGAFCMTMSVQPASLYLAETMDWGKVEK